MNPSAIIALIAELYEKVALLDAENEALKAKARQEPS